MSSIIRQKPRSIKISREINPYAAGSVIVEFGQTKIHITVNIEESVPSWMKGQGRGWVTAEYSMLPGATRTRTSRERSKVKGRTHEIQRLIGRSLRSIVDLEKLGERALVVDCDVLVADGGTRTAAISGAYVALKMATQKLIAQNLIVEDPILEQLGAMSVGIDREGKILVDLDYGEDSTCSTDMNIVMTKSGKFIEIQGTAEERPFSGEELAALLKAADVALKVVFKEQDRVLES